MKKLTNFNLAASTFLMIIMLAQNTNANPTCTVREYEGETIMHCELHEVVITAERPTKSKMKATTYLGEQIITVDLPEVEISAEALPAFNVGALNNGQDNVEPVSSEKAGAAIMISGLNDENKLELKKRPLVPFIANKIFEGGVWFLKKMNEGLFFRS